MNKHEAKALAETVTLDDLRQMFTNAHQSIKDWTTASRPNKGISLGAAFNVLSAGLDIKESIKEIHPLARRNMIWAFGEYLPGYQKPEKQPLPEHAIVHQEPILSVQPKINED